MQTIAEYQLLMLSNVLTLIHRLINVDTLDETQRVFHFSNICIISGLKLYRHNDKSKQQIAIINTLQYEDDDCNDNLMNVCHPSELLK